MPTNATGLPADAAASPRASGQGRNVGIDLLRVVAMFYVLILHTLGQGGVLNAAAEGSAQYHLAWFLEIGAYGAVDIFALISGYVSYSAREKKVHFARYVVLWLQVVFDGLIVTLAYRLLRPELVTGRDFLSALLPVTQGSYWFFSAYTGLFFLMPLLNAGVRKCPDALLRKVFVGLILVFSVYGRMVDHFGLNGGYSVLWIAILYLLGAIIKKCELGSRFRLWQVFLAILLCHLAGWAWHAYGVEFTAFGVVVPRMAFVSYLSPTVVIGSVCYVIGFAKLRFHPGLKKAVSFAAAGAFSVYILNCQRFIYGTELANRFAYLGTASPAVILTHVVGFCLAFLAAALLLDGVRRWLFRALRVTELADRLVAAVDRLLSAVTGARGNG